MLKKIPRWKKFPCKEWDKYRSEDGYGIVQYKGKLWKAHRMAWDMYRGPIPPGKVVRHRCDNPPCWEIEHLRIGTIADNVADMARRGRHGRSTLSNKQVRELRKRREAGEKVHALAAEYGVSPSTVSRIANRTRRIYV